MLEELGLSLQERYCFPLCSCYFTEREGKGKKGTCEGMSEEMLNPSTEEMHNYFMGLKQL